MSLSNEYIDSLLDLFGSAPEPILPRPESAPIPEPACRETGKGAQKRVRATEGVRYVFQADPRGLANAFIGTSTEADRAFYCSELVSQGVEIVERVVGDRPARPYIDVDAPSGASDAEIQRIVDAFSTVAAEVGAPEDRLAPIINACDRPGKRSRHLIADGWAVPDGLAVQRFAEKVKGAVSGAAADWIDRSGGRLSYGLRVAGCPKAGDATAVLTGPLVWLQTDLEPVIEWAVEPTAKESREAPGGPVATLQEFLDAIAASEFNAVYTLAAPTDGCPASYDRIAAGHCRACDRNHERAGAYVSATEDGSFFLRCRRTPKHGPALMSRLASAVPAEFPPADSFDDLVGDSFEVVGGPGVYNKDAIGDDGVSDLYVASAWGTGKSVHNAAIVKSLREREPKAVVIIISSRKSLTAQLVHDIGAVAYSSINGILDPVKCPTSVWQLDSLGRLPPDLRPDLLVIDELCQTVAHAYNGGSDNSKDNAKARAGISTLRCLATAAGRLIITDNDLTTAQVEVFRAMRPRHDLRVVRSAFHPWTGLKARILTGAASKAFVLKELWDLLDSRVAAWKSGQGFKAAVAPCHSKKVARNIERVAIEKYGVAAVRLYTSETGDAIKRKDFSDATASWAPETGGPLLVIYTGTVSVGVSCASDRFDRCFAFFGRGNAASTQSTQMLFRCRNLQEVLVSYAASEVHANRPQQPDALFSWVTQARNLAALPDEFRHDRSPFITLPSSTDPAALKTLLSGSFEGQLWVANEMERHRSDRWFVQRMTRVMERAGITVEVTAVKLPKDREELRPLAEVLIEYDECSELAEEARARMMADALPSRYEASLEAFEHDADPDSEMRDRTEEEKAGDRALYVIRSLSMDAATLVDTRDADGLWLRYYEPLATPYKNAKRLVGGYDGRDPRELATTSEREADGVSRLVFQALGTETCVESLAVEPGALLGEGIIELTKRINTHSVRLFNDSNGAQRAKAIAAPKTTAGRRRQAVVSTLNAVLRRVGAALVAKYDTERQKARGLVARYSLEWGWSVKDAPEPRPAHPTKEAAEAPTRSEGPSAVAPAPSSEDIELLLEELTTNVK